jgi:hypothetical protein
LATASGCTKRPKNFSRRVTGKVTLGGEPLVGAKVIFEPVEEGSASMGVTDATGSYDLVWAQQRGKPIKGAVIGEHNVKISTFREGEPDVEPPVQAQPEKVPFKYRQLDGYPKVTVNKGSNVIDIPLEPGPVDPPPPKKGKGRAPVRRDDC